MPDPLMVWYPAAIRNPAPENLWGSYRDDDNQWKYLLHTTESDVFRPNPTNYFGHTSYPHATAYLPAGEDVARVYQHIPINRAARALKNKPGGVETNADRVVQIEIVGRARYAPNFPKALLDAVRGFGQWAAAQVEMPWQSSVRFVAGGVGVRLSGPAWDNYAGILGHQHAPENDHVDPGAIDIAYILKPPAQPEPPTPLPEDYDMDFFIIRKGDGAARWAWWPESHRKTIIAGDAIAEFAGNEHYGGDLKLEATELDGIPNLAD